ncbi:hypothetical protein GOBAR_AA05706 [Gossypium barbadense]|uniref:Uncharacterized protein n=1 Tax=Gossypium barbadense TaxID=3634 RepID=A0A2P5YH42_GOSBA|nr:hypothetical protein GOBAR_AA05706 [Gossypium barbadense]
MWIVDTTCSTLAKKRRPFYSALSDYRPCWTDGSCSQAPFFLCSRRRNQRNPSRISQLAYKIEGDDDTILGKQGAASVQLWELQTECWVLEVAWSLEAAVGEVVNRYAAGGGKQK